MSQHTPLKTPLPIDVGPVSGRILRGSERFSLETPLPGTPTPVNGSGAHSTLTKRTFLTPLPVAPGQGSAAPETGTSIQRRFQTPLPSTTDITGTTSRIRRSVIGKIVQSIDVPQAAIAPPVLRVAPVARAVAPVAPVAPPVAPVAPIARVAPVADQAQGVTMMCIHCQHMFTAPVNHSFGTVICSHCGAASRVAVHDCPPLKRPQA